MIRIDWLKLTEKLNSPKAQYYLLQRWSPLSEDFAKDFGFQIQDINDDRTVVLANPTKRRFLRGDARFPSTAYLAQLAESCSKVFAMKLYSPSHYDHELFKLNLERFEDIKGIVRATTKKPSTLPVMDGDRASLFLTTHIIDEDGKTVAKAQVQWLLKHWSASV